MVIKRGLFRGNAASVGDAEPETATKPKAIEGTIVQPDAGSETAPGDDRARFVVEVPPPNSAGDDNAGDADDADGTGTGGAGAGDGSPALLADVEGLRASWMRIQSHFVDDPHDAVSQAAGLTAEVASAFVSAIRDRERRLDGMWDRDDGGTGENTDRLRNALLSYRDLFDRLTGA